MAGRATSQTVTTLYSHLGMASQNSNPAGLWATDFLKHHVLEGLLQPVSADQCLLDLARRLDCLLVVLVADLSGLLLAVLGVGVLLSLLWTGLFLGLPYLFWLEMAVLLLNLEGESVGELLATGTMFLRHALAGLL